MEQNNRLQLRYSDEVKQMLFDLAADAGITASEWLRQAITEAWNRRVIETQNPAEQD